MGFFFFFAMELRVTGLNQCPLFRHFRVLLIGSSAIFDLFLFLSEKVLFIVSLAANTINIHVFKGNSQKQ